MSNTHSIVVFILEYYFTNTTTTEKNSIYHPFSSSKILWFTLYFTVIIAYSNRTGNLKFPVSNFKTITSCFIMIECFSYWQHSSSSSSCCKERTHVDKKLQLAINFHCGFNASIQISSFQIGIIGWRTTHFYGITEHLWNGMIFEMNYIGCYF